MLSRNIVKKTQRLQLDNSAAAAATTCTTASNKKKQKMSSSYCPILDLLDSDAQQSVFEFVRTKPSDYNNLRNTCRKFRAVLESACPLLRLLGHDALRAVLMITDGSDRTNLRLTCRKFRAILDDDKFLLDRCEKGYTEIECRLDTPWEQYLIDHGWKHGMPQEPYTEAENEEELEHNLSVLDDAFIENYNDIGYVEFPGGHNDTHATGRIFVDGHHAGDFVVRLLPRQQYNNRHGGFFGMCDAISADVQDLSVRFFTDKGRCTRVSSVRDSLNENSDEMKPLLYVEKFRLSKPMVVGSIALRSLLMDTALAGRWGIAMYIPEGDAFMNQDDRNMYAQIRNTQQPTEEELGTFRVWKRTRYHALVKRDIRQFLRAGFLQARETVFKADYCTLFATPSLLVGADVTTMMSRKEALEIPIEDVQEPRPERSIDTGASIFLDAIITFCGSRKNIMHEIMGLMRQIMMNDVSNADEQAKRLSDRLDLVRAIASLSDLDVRVQSEVTRAVQESGSCEIIIQSDSIACCSNNLCSSYVDLLMSFVPEARKDEAINKFDSHGKTPLVVAALSNNTDDLLLLYITCYYLIDRHGADKNCVDENGLSALGWFRKDRRSYTDFALTYQLHESTERWRKISFIDDHVSPQMEELLRPGIGPTMADDAVMDVDENADDSNEEDGNEEGGTERWFIVEMVIASMMMGNLFRPVRGPAVTDIVV